MERSAEGVLFQGLADCTALLKGPCLDRRARKAKAHGHVLMEVTVNGTARRVPDGLTVRQLIEHLGLIEGPVAVERNREVVPRAEHERTSLASGDVLEIVHFVGGG